VEVILGGVFFESEELTAGERSDIWSGGAGLSNRERAGAGQD
jgi:hypothetical protein